MRPLLVRAHLAHGVAHAGPWAVSLDGLLAAEMWDEHKAAERDAGREAPRLHPGVEPPDLDLPLQRCHGVDNADWHWAATCAFPDAPAGRPTVRYWSGRPDHTALGDLTAALPAVVSERQGPYRSRVMPLLVTSIASVSWRAVGDVDAVQSILKDVAAIGKKRSQGEGRVLRWEFEDRDDDPWAAGHLHPDGTLGRPSPPACFAGRAAPPGEAFGLAAIRPPHMHPSRMRRLYLPTSPHPC